MINVNLIITLLVIIILILLFLVWQKGGSSLKMVAHQNQVLKKEVQKAKEDVADIVDIGSKVVKETVKNIKKELDEKDIQKVISELKDNVELYESGVWANGLNRVVEGYAPCEICSNCTKECAKNLYKNTKAADAYTKNCLLCYAKGWIYLNGKTVIKIFQVLFGKRLMDLIFKVVKCPTSAEERVTNPCIADRFCKVLGDDKVTAGKDIIKKLFGKSQGEQKENISALILSLKGDLVDEIWKKFPNLGIVGDFAKEVFKEYSDALVNDFLAKDAGKWFQKAFFEFISKGGKGIDILEKIYKGLRCDKVYGAVEAARLKQIAEAAIATAEPIDPKDL